MPLVEMPLQIPATSHSRTLFISFFTGTLGAQDNVRPRMMDEIDSCHARATFSFFLFLIRSVEACAELAHFLRSVRSNGSRISDLVAMGA